MIYEVTVCIARQREQEWLSWIIPHVQDILATGCFNQADIEAVEDVENPTYIVRYHYTTTSQYANYVENYASKFRSDGVAIFGSDMHASRRLLSTINQLSIEPI